MEQRYELISRCVVRKLEKEETVESFDCGDTDLNDFFCTNPRITVKHCLQ